MKVNNKGFVYFIQCEELVKIGYSQSIQNRLKQLSTGNGKELKLIYYINGDKNVEWALHKYFESYRVKNEWFELEPVLEWIQHTKKEKEIQRELGLIK